MTGRTWARTAGGSPIVTTYGYAAGYELLAGYATASGRLTSYTYEDGRNLKTSVQNASNTSLVSGYTYDTIIWAGGKARPTPAGLSPDDPLDIGRGMDYMCLTKQEDGQGMVNKRILIAAGLAAVVLIVVAYGIVGRMSGETQTPGAPVEEVRAVSGDKTAVYLYFAARDGASLSAEKHVVEMSDDPAQSALAIIRALARGPERGDLVRTVPPETDCRALYVTKGTAYVDFLPGVRDGHPGGCQAELLTVYAIVNSLAVNVDGIDKVKFLIEGREADTLAGHVDLRSAFAPDMRMVR